MRDPERPTSPTQPHEGGAAPAVDIVGRHSGLELRAALISGLTAFSRLLGYAREFLTALLFGDRSVVYDAFVTAWRVPNLFRRLLGEGAVATALQTALTETDGDLGDEAGRRLFWDVMRLALAVLLALCALLMGAVALLPDRMPWTGWAWLGPQPVELRELLLRVMPYVVFICLAGLAGGALAVRGRFTGSSASAAVMNLIAIGTLVLVGARYGWSGAAPEDGAAGFARHMDMARLFSWGLVLSGVAQLAVLVPDLSRAGLFGRTARAAHAGLRSARQVLTSSAPLALGAAVYQVNVMVDGFMAQGLLAAGGATTYYFANRIQQLPLALVAVAATNAVFPALKALGHTRRHDELRRLHDNTHLAIAFVALPATAGILALATPIVAVLLQHGQFSQEGTVRTALGLRMLALALVPAGAAGLLGRTYFALGDFRTPVRVALGLLVLNVSLNTLFLVGLRLDVEGLALSTTLVSWVNVAVLLPGVWRRLPAGEGARRFAGRLGRMLLAATACGLAAGAAHHLLGGRPGSPGALAAGVGAGIGAYVLAARALRLPEWERVRARLRRRLSPPREG